MGVFEENLAIGQLGESQIAKWLLSRGSSVIPVYEKQIDTGKGPRFFTPQGKFVAPDMFILPSATFVEAKHKTVFTWHRITRRWCTGIDLNHYEEYRRAQEVSERIVWLLFLHRVSIPDMRDLKSGSPSQCPTGLFGGTLDYLARHENHRHNGWGKYGMVYWDADRLTHLDTIEGFDATVRQFDAARAAA